MSEKLLIPVAGHMVGKYLLLVTGGCAESLRDINRNVLGRLMEYVVSRNASLLGNLAAGFPGRERLETPLARIDVE